MKLLYIVSHVCHPPRIFTPLYSKEYFNIVRCNLVRVSGDGPEKWSCVCVCVGPYYEPIVFCFMEAIL